MLRVNMMERVQVVRPFKGATFGRMVLNNHDIAQRRILVESFNGIAHFVKAHRPDIYAGFLNKLESYFSYYKNPSVIKLEGIARLKDGKSLLPEDIDYYKLKTNGFHGGIRQMICSINEYFYENKINGQFIGLQIVNIHPFSLLKIGIKIHSEQPGKAGRPEILQWIEKEKITWWPFMRIKLPEVISEGKIFTENEFVEFLHESCGPLGIGWGLLFFSGFYPLKQVMRPKGLERTERLYFITFSRKATFPNNFVPMYTSKIKYPPAGTVAVFAKTSTAALEGEVEELVKEGRLVPVLTGAEKPAYYTPDYLASSMEEGKIVEIEIDKERNYIRWEAAGKYKGRLVVPPKAKISAGRAFLEFIGSGRFSSEEKRSYPCLAIALEILCSYPSGTEPYIEAARVAAESGASEESLAAILLHNVNLFSNDYRNGEKIKRNTFCSFEDYFIESLSQAYTAQRDAFNESFRIGIKTQRIRSALGLDVNIIRIEDVRDILVYLQLFLSVLHPIDDEKQEDIYLEYFATVLGRLMHLRPGALPENEVKNLRLVVAPMAEACGFLDIAAQIRNEILRITNQRKYSRIKKTLEEKVAELTYFEMRMHLDNNASMLREVLTAAGISSKDYEIEGRVKLPYSIWEKMSSLGIDNPGLIKDIFGINVITKDDRLAYRIMALVKQVIPALTPVNFNDKHGLIDFLGKSDSPQPIYADKIAKPMRSGFSALVYLGVTSLDLPVEVQVTSRERHEKNKKGEAAHWKHKMKRELKHFYGVNAERIDDLPIYSKEFMLLFYGDYEEMTRGGLKYHAFMAKNHFDNILKDFKEKMGSMGFQSDDEFIAIPYWEIKALLDGRIETETLSAEEAVKKFSGFTIKSTYPVPFCGVVVRRKRSKPA